MRFLIWVVILAVVAFLVYNHFFKAQSVEEDQVKQVEKEFNQSVDRYITAMREVGEPGVVVIAEPEFAIKKVQEVRLRLTELMKNLKEEKAIARAQKLETRIREFCSKNEID
jgi:hypothetical protein